jgi:hypothetical protein
MDRSLQVWWHPASPRGRHLNAFCKLAADAADRRTTRELFVRIGDGWDPGVWRERKYFDN